MYMLNNECYMLYVSRVCTYTYTEYEVRTYGPNP